MPSPASATTEEGLELPVIDVTDPRFALADDPASVASLTEDFVAAERRNARVPGFIMRLMLRLAARRSKLLRALLRPDASYLAGMSTYLMKLGVANLPPPFDSDTDRRVAASPHIVAIRLRLQQVAKLLAAGLEDELGKTPGAPLLLLNIGGGPAIDSLNALILLRQSRPDLVARPITIAVFDVDQAGPRFGANALSALSVEGAPLAGLAVTWRHEFYDWNQPSLLERLVHKAIEDGTVLAASSEGALFEYGDDEAIITNLGALHAGGRGARLVVGSVTRGDEIRRRTIAASRFKLVPRGLDCFIPLAARGGFSVARVEPGPLSDQVLLRPA